MKFHDSVKQQKFKNFETLCSIQFSLDNSKTVVWRQTLEACCGCLIICRMQMNTWRKNSLLSHFHLPHPMVVWENHQRVWFEQDIAREWLSEPTPIYKIAPYHLFLSPICKNDMYYYPRDAAGYSISAKYLRCKDSWRFVWQAQYACYLPLFK